MPTGNGKKELQPSIFMHHAVMWMEDLFNANLKTLRLIKNGRHTIKDYDIVREKHVARVR